MCSFSRRNWLAKAAAVGLLAVGLLAAGGGAAQVQGNKAPKGQAKDKAQVVAQASCKPTAPTKPIRPQLPNKVQERVCDWNVIAFDNGVPVGGWCKLVYRSDGTYNFSGHFHDSGAISYDVSLTVMLKGSDSGGYQFSKKGKVGGTLGGGDRNLDWNVSGQSEQLAKCFPGVTSWAGRARTDWNLDDELVNLRRAWNDVKRVVEIFAN
jgi:hypothetical protein